MMLAPTARSGVLVDNPGREVIDEAGGVIGIDFILNVVLDEQRRVIGAVAGDGGHKAAAIAGLLARADARDARRAARQSRARGARRVTRPGPARARRTAKGGRGGPWTAPPALLLCPPARERRGSPGRRRAAV